MKGLVRAVLTVALTMLLSLTLIHAPGAAAASASAGKDATSASLQKKQKTDLDSLGLTPFRRSGGSESRPVARGFGQGDWSDHVEQ
ncbi:hypothetical protein E4A49_11055 [Micrococcus lylae]|uniref:Secreted protein n=1 Tax=Micrococcus lylae TaxID=1273 RepID=A0ABY2K110_9MICC|nr:hypothetical protein E4A49_11055 [Micrococcus lylae]